MEIVFDGFDNTATIQIDLDGVPLDFSAVTRMTLGLRGYDTPIADSDIDPTTIVWTAGDGAVVFTLGHLDVQPGVYQGILVAYDALHPAGQVLAHPSLPGAQLRITFA